jgi:hypothetical protein
MAEDERTQAEQVGIVLVVIAVGVRIHDHPDRLA